MDRLDAEVDNLRAAMAWFLEAGEPEAGLRLASALWDFCHARGYYEEGRAWLEDALSKSGDPPRCGPGRSPGRGSCFPAVRIREGQRARLEESPLAVRGAGRPARGRGGDRRSRRRGARAGETTSGPRTLHEESLALWRDLGDEHGVAESWTISASSRGSTGENERAAELSARPLDMTAPRATRRVSSRPSSTWGPSRSTRGIYERAEAMLDESLALSREGGYREGVGWSLNQLGMVAYRRGDLERAERLLRESLAVHKDLGDMGRVASVLEALAETAGARKRFELSTRLFGAADVLRETIGAPVPPCERAEHDRVLASVRTQVGDKEFTRLRAEGRTMKLEEAFSRALRTGRLSGDHQDVLSAREVEVLGLVAEGLTDQEVAQSLYLSPRTVGQHLSSVYRKLGVRSRTAASRAAAERGLIQPL